MILTVGLTPAWQQILVFDSFRPGRVNRAAEVIWCASGKVFNAGIAVHRLGGPSLTLATVGGLPFEPIRREMAKLGVPCRWVETQAATRVCTTILDRATGEMTELVENGRALSARELDAFRRECQADAAKADVVLVMGTLPAGTPDSYYRDLIATASRRVILDIRGPGLLEVLDLRPYVIKPNRDELAATVGASLGSDADLLTAMRTFNKRGAQWVLVTDGRGPIWLTSENAIHRFEPLAAGPVVNPIGCGDAMAGAIAWATQDGRDIVEAVRLGVAAAAANLRSLLPCRLDRAEVESWADSVAHEIVA